jgi:hypothetical protein
MSTPQDEDTTALSPCELEARLHREIKRLRERINRLPVAQRAEHAAILFDLDLKEMDLNMSALDVQQ